MKKLKNTKQMRKFKYRLLLSILLIDLGVLVATYIVMPIVQGFPPYTEGNFAFQKIAEPITHVQQYALVLLVCYILHFLIFNKIMKRIYNYINKDARKETITCEEIKQVRSDCVSIPYKIYVIQILVVLVIGLILNLVMLVQFFIIIKFILMLISIISLMSIFLLIVTQGQLSKVLESTYSLTKEYEKNNGIRIKLSQDLLLQMLPFMLVVLIIISLLGYAKAVDRKAEASVTYYRHYLSSLEINQHQVNEEQLKLLLNGVPLESPSDYFYIIDSNDKIIYLSNKDGNVSDYMLKYRDFFYDKTGGVVYERPGVSEESYMIKVKDMNNREWYIGFKFATIDESLLLYYFAIIGFMVVLYTILLYIWSKNTSRNIIKITDSLKEILESNTESTRILPIMSNNEYGDLSYYFNKIQERFNEYIEEIQKNQEIITRQAQFAAFGEASGRVAHDINSPAIGVKGEVYYIKSIIENISEEGVFPAKTKQEILSSIENINLGMDKITKISNSLKKKMVNTGDRQKKTFNLKRLVQSIENMMGSTLRNGKCRLNIEIPDELEIFGEENKLDRVITNIIQNSVEAYVEKSSFGTVDILANVQDENCVITIEDQAGGIPDEIMSTLFKEIKTTKVEGTGIGLLGSYKMIIADFGRRNGM